MLNRAKELMLTAWVFAMVAVAASAAEVAPPWPPQYKLRADQPDRLTEADVVGPDGLVYPNWTRCGVQGRMPDPASIHATRVVRIEQFGGRADDGQDDAAALDRACRAVGEQGGGAVVLGPGVYDLHWPVAVHHDGLVIRGQGPAATRVMFRYAIPAGGVGFYTLQPEDRIGPDTAIEVHCLPTGLQKVTVFVGDVVVKEWTRSTHSGNTFAVALRGSDVTRKTPAGRHELRAVAEYQPGSSRAAAIPVRVDPGYRDERRSPTSQAAINFQGPGLTGPKVALAVDGLRGQRTLTLSGELACGPGEFVFVEGPATPRWKTLTKNACLWGDYRQYVAEVERVDGNRVTLTQPLRIEFPIVDGSCVQRFEPVRGGGIQDLTMEQTENLWISSVLFSNAVNCWARNVRVVKCGRYPVYGSRAKWCEIRDCVFDDAWFKGGGGTAYAGWERSWDCLIERLETFKFRHAPLFQWAASGNVIRQSVFHESDAQWHAGWTHENLMEQCVITSSRGHGGYGFGMWASPPEDAAHGPNGPRNVVYNCDVVSEKDGVWLGGMNEAWMILHNRFVVEKGSGLVAKTSSFDHTIRGNVFLLKDPQAAMVRLATADCTGIELVDNVLYGGSGRLIGGDGRPSTLERNRVRPLSDASRPQPAVPSIYEWQRANGR